MGQPLSQTPFKAGFGDGGANHRRRNQQPVYRQVPASSHSLHKHTQGMAVDDAASRSPAFGLPSQIPAAALQCCRLEGTSALPEDAADSSVYMPGRCYMPGRSQGALLL